MAITFPEPLLSSRFDAFTIQVLNNWGGDRTCLAPFLFYRRRLEDPPDSLREFALIYVTRTVAQDLAISLGSA